MNRVAWYAAAALALAACEARSPSADTATSPTVASSPAPDTTASPTPSESPTLSPDGWGPLRIGMTRAGVVAAAGEDANPELVGGPDPAQCDEFRPTRAPAGMLVMIQQGRLTRISLGAKSSVTTNRGFGVGASASAVRAAYSASAVSSPHPYVSAPAEYLTIGMTAPTDSTARGIVYDIGADGRVARIHAGGPSIQYSEGCV